MTPGRNPAYHQEQAPSRYRTWDPGIEELANLPTKQPDLVDHLDIRRLVYRDPSEGKVDERPIITDYESGSTARVLRIMKWADDYVPGHESSKGCCLRFEVQVVKPGRKSCHHEGDVVIWSQTLNDVLNNPVIMGVMRQYGVTAKKIRETLIRDGFPDQAKEI